VARTGERRCEYSVLVGKPERNHFEDLARGGEDNIIRDLKGIRCEDVEWIDLAHDMNSLLALVNAMMNLRVK
jgi:hypothetical protein